VWGLGRLKSVLNPPPPNNNMTIGKKLTHHTLNNRQLIKKLVYMWQIYTDTQELKSRAPKQQSTDSPTKGDYLTGVMDNELRQNKAHPPYGLPLST